MASTPTPNLGLALPARSDRNWDVPTSGNFSSLDGMAPLSNLFVSPNETPSASLNIRVAAGTFVSSVGAVTTFAAQSGFAVPANTFSLVWLTDSGTLATGTSYPTNTPYVPLASVNAGASTITAIADQRIANRSVAGSSSQTPAPVGSTYVTMTTDPTLTAERVLTGTPYQVIITDNGAGNTVVLSLPQNIDPTATPTFAEVLMTGTPTMNGHAATKAYVDSLTTTNSTAAANANTNANSRVLRSGDTMTGTLTFAGLRKPNTTITAGTYNVLPTDMVIRADCTNGAITVNLLVASSGNAGEILVKKIDSTSNAVTIQVSSGSIDGSSSYQIPTQYLAVTLIPDVASNTWGRF